MSQEDFMLTLGRLRWRLRDHAHLFEDPASYVDGVEDALDLVERVAAGEDVEHDDIEMIVTPQDELERTAS